MNLIPLFLVSLAAVGYKIALTRYFAVAEVVGVLATGSSPS